MKKFHKIKQKIIFCVMSVAVLLSVLITIIMSAGNISSTNTALLDNVQTTARIASQGISSNLHLLTERMYNLSQEPVFAGENTDAAAREACLANAKLQIEFVWLSAYDLSGKKLYGDAAAPDSISDQKFLYERNRNPGHRRALLCRQHPAAHRQRTLKNEWRNFRNPYRKL